VASDQVKKTIIVPAGGTSGPNFPPGLLVGDTLYVSAFIGFDSKTNQIPASFEEEMANGIQHARDVLKAGAMDLEDVVSAQVYLTDMKLFDRMKTADRRGRR
jgi:enamine deaminase RidA (YjgF/YER057c/UK114 family)